MTFRRPRAPLQPFVLALLGLTIHAPPHASAQAAPQQWLTLLQRVLPAAERFSDRRGDPPAFEAFRTDPATGAEMLVGYAFFTADLPPEEKGFDGPIQVLVGMDTDGTLTGVAVLDYHESLRSSRGDFLSQTGFQEQFAGKNLNDPFRVKRDVEGVTGATITVGAMSRGVRNAARRIALARGLGSVSGARQAEPLNALTVRADQLVPLTWAEIMVRGLVQQITVLEAGGAAATLTLVYLRDASVGEVLIGPGTFAQAVSRAGTRASGRHMLLVGADGPLAGGLNLERLSVVQNDDTVRVGPDDIFIFGPPQEGKVDGQLQFMRIVLLDGALDMSRPLTYVLDLPRLGVHTAEYPTRRPQMSTTGAAAVAPGGQRGQPGATTPGVANAPPAPPDASAGATTPVATGTTASALDSTPSASVLAPIAPAASSAPLSSTSAAIPDLQVLGDEEGSFLSRTLAETSWGRVTGLLIVLGLAVLAFASKRPALRWVSLGATLAFLGIVDKGFLSVSHLTSGLKVGPEVYFADVPLLLLVIFTVVTTLLWGRVFCGYLCPFGALQDFLERVVPRRFQREMTAPAHRRTALAKYGVLAVVVAPALLGGGVSLYQYFEPFGTVFFPSQSLLLWSIAASLLLASAVVPRFYCRYVCPLGAALALGSLLSPFRIRRVEQCGVCKVCEQRCPTRAIQLERIDFKECVRCNVCEVKLIEKAGVCRHEMEEVRSRLVKLQVSSVTSNCATGIPEAEGRPQRPPRS